MRLAFVLALILFFVPAALAYVVLADRAAEAAAARFTPSSEEEAFWRGAATAPDDTLHAPAPPLRRSRVTAARDGAPRHLGRVRSAPQVPRSVVWRLTDAVDAVSPRIDQLSPQSVTPLGPVRRALDGASAWLVAVGRHGAHHRRHCPGRAPPSPSRAMPSCRSAHRAVSRRDWNGRDDLGTGRLGDARQYHLAGARGLVARARPSRSAAVLAVTIIGIPFAWAHLKLAGLALWPIGRTIVPTGMAPAYYGRWH